MEWLCDAHDNGEEGRVQVNWLCICPAFCPAYAQPPWGSVAWQLFGSSDLHCYVYGCTSILLCLVKVPVCSLTFAWCCTVHNMTTTDSTVHTHKTWRIILKHSQNAGRSYSRVILYYDRAIYFHAALSYCKMVGSILYSGGYELFLFWEIRPPT